MYNQLIEKTITSDADNKALEHRNKLLEFDRTRLEISKCYQLQFNENIPKIFQKL